MKPGRNEVLYYLYLSRNNPLEGEYMQAEYMPILSQVYKYTATRPNYSTTGIAEQYVPSTVSNNENYVARSFLFKVALVVSEYQIELISLVGNSLLGILNFQKSAPVGKQISEQGSDFSFEGKRKRGE